MNQLVQRIVGRRRPVPVLYMSLGNFGFATATKSSTTTR